MDLSTRVNYEHLFALELKDPVTDEPLGVTFHIRSAGSEKAKEVQRNHTSKNLKRVMRRKDPTAEMLETEELEKAASYIASWNWGEHTYKGEKPELSMKTAMAILQDEGWIFGQVVEAAHKIENFTPASGKPSVNG